jgi:hypothetical protein
VPGESPAQAAKRRASDREAICPQGWSRFGTAAAQTEALRRRLWAEINKNLRKTMYLKG